MPRSPHAMPQRPIAVSNNAKWLLMARSDVFHAIYNVAKDIGLEILAFHPLSDFLRTQRSAPFFTAWCAAEPGPYRTRCFWRSRFSEASLRKGYALHRARETSTLLHS